MSSNLRNLSSNKWYMCEYYILKVIILIGVLKAMGLMTPHQYTIIYVGKNEIIIHCR